MDREQRARALKASRLADFLTELRAKVPALVAEVLEHSSQAEREAYAAAAGTRPPSDQTWELVIAILRQREDPQPADPFDGVSAVGA